jgi:GntR family negative regulator for fad regulon and positive regulator of fabA
MEAYMNRFSAPKRPAAHAEQSLITVILDGTYSPGSVLPGERELSQQLGITRPTLRETLQRMERDGWIIIRHGKYTVVNDYWHDGGLGVLNGLFRYGKKLPENFVTHLLEIRMNVAPYYTRSAVERAPEVIKDYLAGAKEIEDTAEALASFDWTLHKTLALNSSNPLYTLILNGFTEFYQNMAQIYFSTAEARDRSFCFYKDLITTVKHRNPDAAEKISRIMMKDSIAIWQKTERQLKSRLEVKSAQGGR